jgi:hypothetical protein
MKALVALLVTILVGCGAAVESSESPAPTQVVEQAPEASTTPAEPEIWLSENHPAYQAQQTWGLPLKRAVTVVFVPGDDASIPCGHEPVKGYPVGGCSDYKNYTITIAADRPEDSKQMILLHELGHIYRQGEGHIPDVVGCPPGKAGIHVMCSVGRVEYGAPDSVDYAFVLREAPYNVEYVYQH